MSLDASLVHRRIADVYQLVDVNGIYPDGPGKPFVGFGRVDPTRGIYFQQTNSTWSKYVYTGLEVTVSKQMSNRYQFLVGIHRQWQHQTGTWNPTDPARFIQPDAFPNDKGLWMTARQLRSQQLRSARSRQRVRADVEALHDPDGHHLAGACGNRRRRQLRHHGRARIPARS